MRKIVAPLASSLLMLMVALTTAACTKDPDSQNVADTRNSAGAALERSANELDATTDNATDATVANINAEANDAAAANATNAENTNAAN